MLNREVCLACQRRNCASLWGADGLGVFIFYWLQGKALCPKHYFTNIWDAPPERCCYQLEHLMAESEEEEPLREVYQLFLNKGNKLGHILNNIFCAFCYANIEDGDLHLEKQDGVWWPTLVVTLYTMLDKRQIRMRKKSLQTVSGLGRVKLRVYGKNA